MLELQRLLSDKGRHDRAAVRRQPGAVPLRGHGFVTKAGRRQVPDYNRVIPRNHPNIPILGREALLRRCSVPRSRPAKVLGACALNLERGSLRAAANNAD